MKLSRIIIKRSAVALLSAFALVGVAAAQTRAADESVTVTPLTVEQKIADLYQRLFLSSRFDENQQLISAKAQAQAGIASAVIFYGDRKKNELPVWVLGIELGTYASKGDVVFAYTCARNGVGKTDIARTTIREAVAGEKIQSKCSGGGPTKYEYITAFWTKLVDQMYASEPAQRDAFAQLINYRPYTAKAKDKIDASDDYNNIADARADGDTDHGTAGMRTSTRFDWTRGPTPF